MGESFCDLGLNSMSDNGSNSIWRIILARQILVVLVILQWADHGIADSDLDSRMQEIRMTWNSFAASTKPSSCSYKSRLYRAEGESPIKLESERIVNQVVDAQHGILHDVHIYEYVNNEIRKKDHEVLITNDHYSCRLSDKFDDGRYIIVVPPTLHDKKIDDKRLEKSRLYARLPWLNPDQTFLIPDLLDQKISQISPIEEIGNGLQKITFRARTDLLPEEKAKFRGVATGTLTLNHSRHYRVESMELQFEQLSLVKKYRISYDESPDRGYLPKNIISEAKWLRQDRVLMSGKQEYKYECHHDIASDPRQFYLSYYDLPELEGLSPPKKPIPLYVWLLSAAGGLAVIALVSRWLFHRRTKIATPPAV